MKTTILIAAVIFSTVSCSTPVDKESVKKEILLTEQNFEKMAFESGIAEAFYFFADEQAVIVRENDSIIKGKDSIRDYYLSKNFKNTSVNWSPDFIDVSDCGNLAYTYGKYVWKTITETGDTLENRGIFHTVWKKQANNEWKYVWD